MTEPADLCVSCGVYPPGDLAGLYCWKCRGIDADLDDDVT